MKKKVLILALIGCLGATAAFGVTVDLSTKTTPLASTKFADPSGTVLTSGNRVVVGWFNAATPSTYFATNGTNLSQLYTDFVSYGTFTLAGTDPYVCQIGNLDVTGNTQFKLQSAIEGTDLSSKSIYLWVFQTADGSANMGAGFSNVIAHGVYSSSLTNWNFGSSDLAPSITLKTSQVNQFYVGSAGTGSLKLAALTPIPEASSAMLMLGGLGLLAMGNRRRSRK